MRVCEGRLHFEMRGCIVWCSITREKHIVLYYSLSLVSSFNDETKEH